MTDSSLGRIWVLADDRAGNSAQALGVAETLKIPFTVKEVHYNRWGRLPNLLRGASLRGVDALSRSILTPPWPDVAIAAGRRTAPILRWLKRCGCRLTVQIMDPGMPRDGLDLIAIPNHDASSLTGTNIIPITGAPHRISPTRLQQEADRWRRNFDHLPRPWIAVIVGGATKNRPFTAEMARTLAEPVARYACEKQGSIFLTTSRRTGEEPTKVLLDILPEPRFTYIWGNPGENPYFAYLAMADIIVVTGDSMSMCSEAVAAPAPVFIYAPSDAIAPKHARLHQELYTLGLAAPLEVLGDDGATPPVKPVIAGAASVIASEILKHLYA